MGKWRDQGEGVNVLDRVMHADFTYMGGRVFMTDCDGQGGEFLFRADIASPIVLRPVMGKHYNLLDLLISAWNVFIRCGLVSVLRGAMGTSILSSATQHSSKSPSRSGDLHVYIITPQTPIQQNTPYLFSGIPQRCWVPEKPLDLPADFCSSPNSSGFPLRLVWQCSASAKAQLTYNAMLGATKPYRGVQQSAGSGPIRQDPTANSRIWR